LVAIQGAWKECHGSGKVYVILMKRMKTKARVMIQNGRKFNLAVLQHRD
jgi:hypothetical protein